MSRFTKAKLGIAATSAFVAASIAPLTGSPTLSAAYSTNWIVIQDATELSISGTGEENRGTATQASFTGPWGYGCASPRASTFQYVKWNIDYIRGDRVRTSAEVRIENNGGRDFHLQGVRVNDPNGNQLFFEWAYGSHGGGTVRPGASLTFTTPYMTSTRTSTQGPTIQVNVTPASVNGDNFYGCDQLMVFQHHMRFTSGK